jgi:DNA helicase-2/ATP-dependent DNA helicase PcrA
MESISQLKFNQEYQKLNLEQKIAVDTIEGPVMVIAGAGTGKTQTIALRIANILLNTQTPPSSILCLTFTETGTVAMRQRLIEIIGPAAYSVKINTFHAFCNEVIKTNPEYFIFAKNIDSLEELEKIEIIQSLIERLPDNAVLKPWGDHTYYQREIIGNIQKLKRENITPEKFLKLIDDQQKFLESTKDIYASLKSLKSSKTLESELLIIADNLQKSSLRFASISALINFYRTLYNSGYYVVGAAKNPAINYKNALIKFFDNLSKDIPKQLEFQKIYSEYQSELRKRGRYDFDDMIVFVLNQFKESPDLLANYQEQFHYILVDEYQDTNATQNEVIRLLGSYFESPNIFVVGDDDQSIYRFQGAAIENIFDFYKTYEREVKIIALKNNYRSHQLILDSSQSVISNNKNRITSYIKDLDKSLKSVKTYDPDPINFFEANTCFEENYYVASKIKDLLQKGVSPGEIAILARTHKDISDLTETLDNMEVKYHLGYGDNVLEDIIIQQLIRLLNYINNPGDDQSLFHILSFGFLKINSFDLLKILRHSRKHHISLSDLISSREKLESIDPGIRKKTITKLINFSLRTAKSRKWLANYNLDKFYNKFIRKFGFLQYILDQKDIFIINHLNVFYSELKRLALTQNYSLEQFLKRVDLLVENRLALSAPELTSDLDGAVRIMTVHGAKGLEFEHVFLVKCANKNWGNNARTSTIRLPYGIIKTELSLFANDDNEEERRLFYVALTRAKNQIYISYSRKNESDHEQNPSLFTAEIDSNLVEIVHGDPEIQKQALLASVPLVQKSLITDRQLEKYLRHYLSHDYVFNVSHLNSYLRCPLCFYYKTILRIPAVKDKYASLGTAVHDSLSYLFEQFKNSKNLISEAEFLKIFNGYLLKENLSHLEFSETLNRGNEILSSYYQNYQDTFSCDCLTEFDFVHDHVHLGNIPVTGKIDKIEILKTSINGSPDVNVVDFKTGNPDTKSKELKEDGEYFRQLVFYKLLADNDPCFKYHVVSGTIDFVQKSKSKDSFVKKEFTITDKHINDLKLLIEDVYEDILNLEFNEIGPECRDSLGLHHLLK